MPVSMVGDARTGRAIIAEWPYDSGAWPLPRRVPMPRHSTTTLARRTATSRLAWACAVVWLACGACSPERTDPNAHGADAQAGDGAGADASAKPTKALLLAAVTPARGPIAGGGQLDVEGTGFAADAQVWIGNEPAEVAFRAGSTHIFVVAPASALAGAVDVQVRNSKTSTVTRAKGYTYLGEVTIDAVAPLQGPTAGGTQITVHGAGFLAGDRILVGDKEAMASEVLDPNTVVAIVPARTLPAGVDLLPVPIAVRHASGVAQAGQSFTYGRAPRVDLVDPPVVGLDGGAVTLHGAGLGNATAMYAHGAQGVLASGTAGSVRGAALPALHALDASAQPGPSDLLLTGPFGASKLFPAFIYAAPTGSPVLHGVVPAAGTSSGDTPATLMLALPAKATVLSVTFGGKIAVFQQTGALVTVLTPSHVPGAVAVEVKTDQGLAHKDAAFTYVTPLTVTKLVPDLGSPAGGTKTDVKGTGFSAKCAVRIGLYAAKVVSAAADGKTLAVVTPPGASGSADVEVTCPGGTALLADGFAYSDGKLHLNVVTPNSGATGGGTPVQLHGSGFKKGMQVYFDGKPAMAVIVQSSALIVAKSPPHPAGIVTVDIVFGQDSDSLLDAFVYENPTSPHGGTAGTQALGTLNVTVLNIYTLEAIEEAYVQVGQPGSAMYPKFNGITDADGQVVFSGADLIAPLTVSATKEQFSASSIVSFDARNATLLLFPLVPPSSGQGTPPTPLPLALLRGTVLDLDKYLLVPPTNCLKSGILGTGDKTCDVCMAEQDCAGTSQSGASYACVDNGVAGKLCLANCSEADVCTKGFKCLEEPSQPGLKVCKPQMGIRKVLCSTSVRSWESENDNPPPAKNAPKGSTSLPWSSAVVDNDTGKFEISSRLDELAIQCIGGYVDNQTKLFVPTAMGVRRHVFPIPGAFTDGLEKDGTANPNKVWPQNHLDVKLDIPLRRKLAIRLDHPQHSFDSEPGTLRVTPWIDLGSDGLVQLPRFEQLAVGTVSGVVDDIDLAYQPVALPQELSETHYVYFARAEYGTGETGQPPISATLHPDITSPGNDNLRIREQDGTAADVAVGLDMDLSAILAGDDGQVLLVARNGRLYRGPVDTASVIYVPPVVDPYAEPVAMLAAGGTPTDATIVGLGGTIRRLKGPLVTTEIGALSVPLRGVCHGPFGRVAVGDGGGVEVEVNGVWQLVTVNTTAALRAVVCTGNGALAVGDDGQLVSIVLTGPAPQAYAESIAKATLRAIAVDAQGQVWIGGDAAVGQGPVLLRRSAKGTWLGGWPPGTVAPSLAPVRGLVPMAGNALLVLDAEGGVLRLDAAGLHVETSNRRDLRLRGGVALPDGRVVMVGQPGLWLGPFLTVPAIEKPITVVKGGPVPVTWSMAPGPTPSFTRVHMDGNGFPFWWLYVGPETTTLTLPDFSTLAGIKVFINNPQITYIIHVSRGYMPEFSINGFSTFDLEFDTWRSWAENAHVLAK